MYSKKQVRELIIKIKKNMNPEEARQKGNMIIENLQMMKEYQSAQWIYSYVAFNREVQTRELISRSRYSGKRVAVPRVEGKSIEFYEIDNLNDLREGPMGIWEPLKSCKRAFSQDALMLIPGLAFDKAFNRIGYGGGFYDRYLAEHPNHTTIALTYDFQLFYRIPNDLHDQKMDIIITDEGIYRSHSMIPEA